MLKFSKYIFLIALAVFVGCKSETKKITTQNMAEPISVQNQAKIDSMDILVQGLIDGKKSAGAALGIQIGNSQPIIRTYGYANISEERQVKANDQFRIASITKPFTATAIIQLIEEGKLSFDDKIDRFFPNFPRGGELTIYQLLSHTSGIRNWYDIKMPDPTPDNFPMCAEPHKYIEKMEKIFLFEPGQYHSYSNTGYVLLGEIIEKVSGLTYEAFLKKKIFIPSGMVDTEMETIENISDQWTNGYGYNDSLSNPFIEPETYPMPYAEGGLRSTADDLLKFIRVFNNDKLVSDEYRNQMTSYAKVKDGSDVALDNFYFPSNAVPPELPKYVQKYGYGLGFSRADIYNSIYIWHGGSIAGFLSVLIYLPKSETTLVLLTNTGDPGGYPTIMEDVQRIVTEIE